MKQIAIDGLAGSGKGTVAKIIADRCNLVYIDTGATYRCVALAAIEKNIDITDEEKVYELAKTLNIEFVNDKTYLNGKDVSQDIRSMQVNNVVYEISKIKKVRDVMVDLQKKLASNKDVIMEGRDITTVVLPNASYKFYLDANVELRAERRYEQYKEKGINISIEEIINSIKKRDYNDMNKEIGALKRTDDQIYINTTNMKVEEVVEKIMNIIGE